MAGEPTPLGSFGQLPLELRQMIYKKCDKLNIRRLLRINTTFYSEYLEVIQKRAVDGTLRFHIDPSKHPSTVDILTEYGRPCGSINAASPHLHADTNPIRTMPIGRYLRLKLTIDAPDARDPGQSVRLCKQVSALVTSLSPCWFPSSTSPIPSKPSDCLFPLQMKIPIEALPKIGYSPPHSILVVRFNGIETGRWGRVGNWCKNKPYDPDDCHDERSAWAACQHSMFAWALSFLQQIRRLPVILDSRRWRHSAQAMLWLETETRAITSCNEAFGLNWTGGDAMEEEFGIIGWDRQYFDFDDRKLLSKVHAFQAWNEYVLDDMSGRSADLLRQERFVNWCGAYERQHGRALWGIYSPPHDRSGSTGKPIHPNPRAYGKEGKYRWIAGADETTTDEVWDEIDSSFHSRFWARMTCDLSDPAGVKRKSKNKLWTDFPEKPEVGVCDKDGFYLVDDEDEEHEKLASKLQRLTMGWTECAVCKAEEDRNRNVVAQKSVREMLEALSTPSGLVDRHDLH